MNLQITDYLCSWIARIHRFSYVRAGHTHTLEQGLRLLRKSYSRALGDPPHPECGIFNQMVLYLGRCPSPQ